MINLAKKLIWEFKGDSYLPGDHALHSSHELLKRAGQKAVLIHSGFSGMKEHIKILEQCASKAGMEIIARIKGSGANTPREDVYRLAEELKQQEYDFLISFGGGSTIDAAKAAEVVACLGSPIDQYFGTGKVSQALENNEKSLHPHLAIQTAASSAAHLTKYSNVTDLGSSQKKLIVDDAIVPEFAIFDYTFPSTSSKSLLLDGALDSFSHCLEVLYGAVNKPNYAEIEEICLSGIELIINYLPDFLRDPNDPAAREAICLAADLGGYAIMVGGTNGGHLTSFSLVCLLSHGRACAILNPYYTVFFAPAIQKPLAKLSKIYQQAGYLKEDGNSELGKSVANAMFNFAENIGFPTRLNQIDGFSDAHIHQALQAAKNPQLKMKLENMPMPLNADMIDEYMEPILRAAESGELIKIKPLK